MVFSKNGVERTLSFPSFPQAANMGLSGDEGRHDSILAS